MNFTFQSYLLFNRFSIKGGEKTTDPHGYTLGRELSPVGTFINDCCMLNYDEKAKWLEDQNSGTVEPSNSCSSIKFKGDFLKL